MSLLLGNLWNLIDDLWDGTALPAPDAVDVVIVEGPVEDDYVVAPRE